MVPAFPLTDYAENFALGYPHTNSFVGQGRGIVLSRRDEQAVSLWHHDLSSGQRRELCRFGREAQPDGMLWSDVALDADRLVTVADNTLWLVNLAAPDALPKPVGRPGGTDRLHPMPGIRRDGRKALCARYRQGAREQSCAWQIDLETGANEVLFEQPWWVDHLHYCPFDSEWIGFSHEGFYADVADRVWGWHQREASAGRCVFDQRWDHAGQRLCVGHERWSFHDRSVLIVAYGDSPGEPLGIYEAFTDGRASRLVSAGRRDMHLDVSRDGRWVVVDTSGPSDLPGKGWANARERSDVLVLDRQSGERRFVAHSSITKHPSHPHPVFSPDGTRVYFNEGEAGSTRNRVWSAPNPFQPSNDEDAKPIS